MNKETIETIREANKILEEIVIHTKNLSEAFLGRDEKKLNDELYALKTTIKELDDINSRFPATQEFLQSKGLTHVSELDEEGRKELEVYLKKTLDSLLAGGKR